MQFDLKEGSFSDKLFTVKTMIRKSFEIEELYNTKLNQLEIYKQDNKKVISKKPENIEINNMDAAKFFAKEKSKTRRYARG